MKDRQHNGHKKNRGDDKQWPTQHRKLNIEQHESH